MNLISLITLVHIFQLTSCRNLRAQGVFRAHPSLLKNKEYRNLIQNLITYTMVEDMEDKQCPDYAEWIGILAIKEHLEN